MFSTLGKKEGLFFLHISQSFLLSFLLPSLVFFLFPHLSLSVKKTQGPGNGLTSSGKNSPRQHFASCEHPHVFWKAMFNNFDMLPSILELLKHA